MGEQRIRVTVGEGQTERKGLLRFVLENEGYDVVAEAASTLELAQRLVIHRPDVVVLDDGIDASAVGMIREVLPSAKVILVWPRGVAAVGVEARLEPSEVMTSLGSTVARVAGRGSVIAPPRPRVSPPDVIVVPEPDAPPGPEAIPDVPPAVAGPMTPSAAIPAADVEEEVTDAAAGAPPEGVVATEAEPLSHILLHPNDLASPTWTYTAPGERPAPDGRSRIAVVALAVVAGVLAIALGVALLNPRTIPAVILAGSVGDITLPGSNPHVDMVSTVPGTFEGIVHVMADGSLTLRASGDIRLRIDGLAHVVASGDVKVKGDGVVHTISAARVRVRGNGTIRITVTNGQIRLRLQGTVNTQGEGVVRVGGVGRFLITHRPVS